MKITKQDLDQSQIQLTIEVADSEMEKFVKKSAQRLSETAKIEGFRPGKAPFEVVKKHLGEMKIYEQALDDIISNYYWLALEQEKIESIGQPKIEVEKFAPGNELVFKAIVALLPKVKLGTYTDLKIKKNEAGVDPKEVDKIINDLREMRAKESAKLEAVAKDDKAEVDFSISLDGQQIEGGKAEKYPLVIGNNKMIPGFEEQIIGMTAGEEKEFRLSFPANYHNAAVAGKECVFKVKIQNVFRRELPEFTDQFVTELGDFKNVNDFKEKMTVNIKNEKQYKENQKAEIAMLEKILEKSEFDPIPEVLIEAESHKMLHELQHSIESQGMVWDDYLNSIKKDHDTLQADFKEGAERRVKTSLIMREITLKEGLTVTKDEVLAEVAKLKEQFKDNPQAMENLESEGYLKYLENSMNNDKVLKFLREKNIQ
ncbi:MAG: trigger factor [Candidatus Komeilibacteria bacterium]